VNKNVKQMPFCKFTASALTDVNKIMRQKN